MKKKCIVCESKIDLTKHHLFPQCFGKQLKWYYFDDIINETTTICRKCHDIYEHRAHILKKDIAIYYNYPNRGSHIFDKQLQLLKNYAVLYFKKNTILKTKEKIRRFFAKKLGLLLNNITKKLIRKFTKIKETFVNPNYIPFGRYILDKVVLLDFIRFWKNDFYNWRTYETH